MSKVMCVVFGKPGKSLRTARGSRITGNSEDHRGTPEAPGRVVTLIDRSHWETLTDQHSDAPPTTWGAAYRVSHSSEPET